MLLLGAVLFGVGIIGGGDVKLLAAVSLWVGWARLMEYVLAVSLLGGILGLVLLVGRKWVVVVEPYWLRLGVKTPRVLQPGEGVPYGLAIGGGLFATIGIFHGVGGP